MRLKTIECSLLWVNMGEQVFGMLNFWPFRHFVRANLWHQPHYYTFSHSQFHIEIFVCIQMKTAYRWYVRRAIPCAREQDGSSIPSEMIRRNSRDHLSCGCTETHFKWPARQTVSVSVCLLLAFFLQFPGNIIPWELNALVHRTLKSNAWHYLSIRLHVVGTYRTYMQQMGNYKFCRKKNMIGPEHRIFTDIRVVVYWLRYSHAFSAHESFVIWPVYSNNLAVGEFPQFFRCPVFRLFLVRVCVCVSVEQYILRPLVFFSQHNH